jgi:hypothetical protein
MERVHYFRRTAAPLGVLAGHLLFGERGEPVDRVGAPTFVEVLELSRGHLPFGVVNDAGEVVRSDVRRVPDVECPDLDVVNVDKQEKLPQLGH